MARILLIHGAAHGAWCWRDVIPALAERGHQARAIDLPSHGPDTTPAAEVTLPSYVQALQAALDEPAVIVAHSMGGVPATQVAELAPELVQRLIYLCAYLPEDGDSVASLRRAGPSQPLLPAILRDPGGVTFRFDPALAREKFYHDCPPTLVDRALRHLTPQPIRPQEDGVSLAGIAETVPRSYIVCAQDAAIPPDYQRAMASVLPRDEVVEMTCSHSPFLSDPDGLAAVIDRLVTADGKTAP